MVTQYAISLPTLEFPSIHRTASFASRIPESDSEKKNKIGTRLMSVQASSQTMFQGRNIHPPCHFKDKFEVAIETSILVGSGSYLPSGRICES